MREKKDALERLKQADPAKLTIGQRIRLIRGNMTQTGFGKLLKKSQDAISVYETDAVTPPLDVLAKLAEIGNVTIDWLIHGPSTTSHKDGIVFHSHIIKPGTPEWRILGIMTGINNPELKHKIVELVNSFIGIEKKK